MGPTDTQLRFKGLNLKTQGRPDPSLSRFSFIVSAIALVVQLAIRADTFFHLVSGSVRWPGAKGFSWGGWGGVRCRQIRYSEVWGCPGPGNGSTSKHAEMRGNKTGEYSNYLNDLLT
jgi:hypothetical protein